ncbi:MAG: hypothetical protein JJD92_07100 [Frankiaceae bacterium]|nr:hypothetical protein [Frankiaceae bacterium]
MRTIVTATVTAAVTAAGALPAGAKAPEHPLTSYIGACNMVNNPVAMFEIAMVNAAEQGNTGMFLGAAASGDPGCAISLTP